MELMTMLKKMSTNHIVFTLGRYVKKMDYLPNFFKDIYILHSELLKIIIYDHKYLILKIVI